MALALYLGHRSRLLREMGIRHAVIGAMAMAVHGYERATLDFDIGTVSDPFAQLTNVARRLEDLGYATTLTTPDGDELGGERWRPFIRAFDGEGMRTYTYATSRAHCMFAYDTNREDILVD